MKTRQQALMRQLPLFDDSYEVYMVLPEEPEYDGDTKMEVLRITGNEELYMVVPIN